MPNNNFNIIDTAKNIILKYNNASLSLIQVHLKISEQEALSIMQHLSAVGFISDYTKPPIRILGNATTSSLNTNPQTSIGNTYNSGAPIFDDMDGHDFEYFCADILKYNGFSKIQVTSGSGDFGIDILCYKANESYAIQCKCYNGKVGNHAVQEAVSGKLFYKCDHAVVMTNSTFTHAAEETARLTDANLWDRSVVNTYYKNSLAQGYSPRYKKMR